MFRTFSLVRMLYPSLTWRIPTTQKVLYITFDDGPVPEVTPWVLDTLKAYNAKATFFCIGHNVEKHTKVYNAILTEGHAVGNHTFNHLKGWQTGTKRYLKNIDLCTEVVGTHLFRPPYGRITRTQVEGARRRGFKIFMWDVLSWDFERRISAQRSLRGILKAVRPGSIIVFHDSIKAKEKLEYILPRALEAWQAEGYSFEVLV